MRVGGRERHTHTQPKLFHFPFIKAFILHQCRIPELNSLFGKIHHFFGCENVKSHIRNEPSGQPMLITACLPNSLVSFFGFSFSWLIVIFWLKHGGYLYFRWLDNRLTEFNWLNWCDMNKCFIDYIFYFHISSSRSVERFNWICHHTAVDASCTLYNTKTLFPFYQIENNKV